MITNKILVTGASGFIGSHILSQLVKDGFSCKAISRNSQTSMPHIEWIKADLLDPSQYEAHLKDVDVIIHAAGVISYQKKDKHHLYLGNYIVTRDLVDLALKYSIPRILFVSSASTLIRSGNSNLISIHGNGNPVFNSWYTKTKFHAELEIRRAEAEGMKICILHSSLVIGQGSWETGSMQIFEKVNQGISHYPPGNLGIVAVEDLVYFVNRFCRNETGDTQILVNAEVWTFKDFLNEIALQLGKKKIVKEASIRMARLLSIIDYFQSIIINEPALITMETIRSAFSRFIYDKTSIMDTNDYKFKEIRPLIREIARLKAK